VWACTDTVSDGTHPSASGQAKVAGLLLDFLKTDPTAAPWFLAGPPLPLPAESEPNDSPATANAIADGFTLAGSIATASDVDHFVLAGRAGEEIRVRVRTPRSSLDPRFTLSAGNATLVSDANDDDGSDAFGCVVLGADAALDLAVTGEGGTTGAYEVSVEKARRTGSESEPNGTPALANFLRDGDLLSASIDPVGDNDLYSFTATAGTGFEIAVRTCGGLTGAGRNMQMRVVDGTGAVLFQDDDSGPDADPYIAGVLPPAGGGYFIDVRSFNNQSGDPQFLYEIEMHLANVTFTATPIDRGPLYAPGERLNFSLSAANRTPSPQSGFTFLVTAQPIAGGPVVTLRNRRVAGPLAGGFARTKTLSMNAPPSLPRGVPLRVTLSLAQDAGFSVVRHAEVTLAP
jgi:pre-peptidase